MKLRNKKTGEIIECPMIRMSIGVCDLMRYEFPNSLAELNGVWEDYELKEPLINDEDARDAIGSWASAHQTYQVRCTKATRGLGVEVTTFEAIELHSAPKIEFTSLDADVDDGKIYNTVELCGEEDE